MLCKAITSTDKTLVICLFNVRCFKSRVFVLHVFVQHSRPYPEFKVSYYIKQKFISQTQIYNSFISKNVNHLNSNLKNPQVCCSLTQCIYLRDRSQGKSCDFTFILFNASFVNFTALNK